MVTGRLLASLRKLTGSSCQRLETAYTVKVASARLDPTGTLRSSRTKARTASLCFARVLFDRRHKSLSLRIPPNFAFRFPEGIAAVGNAEMLDPRLPDSGRVAAVLPTCSIHGVTQTIRLFNSRHFSRRHRGGLRIFTERRSECERGLSPTACTSKVEILVEKPRGRRAVRLSRLRVSCRPRQEHPFFRELDRLIREA